MKKTVMIVFAAVLTVGFLSLVGCSMSAKKADTKKATSPGSTENMQIASPFVKCGNLDEAAKIAGFGLSVPKTPDAVEAVENEMLQALWGDDGQDMCIRKAVGSSDISGDYNVYDKIITASGVTLKGNENGFTLAVWSDGDYSYSLSVGSPVSQSEIIGLAAGVA